MEKYIVTHAKTGIAIMFGALLLLNIYDGYSTTVLLKAGAEEANPVMAAVMGKIGVMPAIIVTKTFFLTLLVGFIFLMKTNVEHAIMTGGLLFLIGWYGAVMLFTNYRLMTLMS